MILSTGFETGRPGQLMAQSASGATIITTSPYAGSYCAEIDIPASSETGYQTQWTQPRIDDLANENKRVMPVRLWFALKIKTKPDAVHNIVEIGGQWRQVGINTAGTILLGNSDEDQIGGNGPTMVVDDWYVFLMDFWPFRPWYCRAWYQAPADGSWQDWFDESVNSDAHCDGMPSSGAIAEVRFGNSLKTVPSAGTGLYHLDECGVVVPDIHNGGAGGHGDYLFRGFETGFLEHKVLVPNGDVTTDWDTYGSGSSHSDRLDELPADITEVDGVKTTVDNEDDKFNMSAAESGKTPRNLGLHVHGWNAGTINQDNFRQGIDDNGTVLEVEVTTSRVDSQASPSEDAVDSISVDKRPDNGQQWTEAAVNAVQALVRTKAEGLGGDYRVSSVLIEEAFESALGQPTRDYKGRKMFNRVSVM